MLTGGEHRFRDTIASALGWWADAGVDTWIQEAPRDWLAPPPPRPTALESVVDAPAAAPRSASQSDAPPRELAALQAWLGSGNYMPGAPPVRRRIAPTGVAGAALMIVADMPDDADLAAGRLFATESVLFDAMLAALGTTREAVYLAPLSPGRLTGGRIGGARDPLVALLHLQMALVKPRAVLLFGDETSRALLGVDRAEGSQALRPLNHDGGTMAAIATIHPRHLRRQPALKADAWRAMRLLLGELAR